MKDKEIYGFLTSKCKEKGIKIESLPGRCNFSRSTLYRYMKGILHMNPEVEGTFARVLTLDEADRQELSRLNGLAAYDDSLIASRYALDSLVFDLPGDRAEPQEIQFAYYDDNKYLRTLDEIFGSIYHQSQKEDFACDIKLLGCISDQYFRHISPFAHRILCRPATAIEHLLLFSKKDYLQNTNILINILPLLKFNGYQVMYGEQAGMEEMKVFLGDIMIIHSSHYAAGQRVDKYYVISFMAEELSECIAYDNPYLYTFFINHYNNYKRQYCEALLTSKNINLLSSAMANIERDHNACLIKPNSCFNKIPIEAYKRLVARTEPDALANFIRAQTYSGSNPFHFDDAVAEILDNLSLRVEYSKEMIHTDVYSTGGMVELAKTGRISDHLVGMPAFDKVELRMIFEYLRDRNADPQDSYNLYLVGRNVLPQGYIISAFEGLGVFIEYNQVEYQHGICRNLFIRDAMLAEVFADYAKNHIPDQYALSKAETTAFFNMLIHQLESSVI